MVVVMVVWKAALTAESSVGCMVEQSVVKTVDT